MTTTPCLWFDTQGEDAATFYCSVFPNSRILRTTHYGPNTPGREGSVMTVDFELNGQKYVALNGGPEFTFSEAISFYIECADQAEIDHYWNALTDGGEPGPCFAIGKPHAKDITVPEPPARPGANPSFR